MIIPSKPYNRIHDLTGKRFGNLVVIAMSDERFHRQVKWVCKCDCGNIKNIASHKLSTGEIKSCGCMQYVRTHGLTGTRLYRIWQSMKNRCGNPNVPCYKYYGGISISVCAEWLHFETFYEWAMQNGYRDDLTIDRMDYDGNYEPSNCRWATWKEQRSHQRPRKAVQHSH